MTLRAKLWTLYHRPPPPSHEATSQTPPSHEASYLVTRGPVSEAELDTAAGLLGIGGHWTAVVDEVGAELAALLEKGLLKVGPVDDPRVGQSEEVGALFEGEADEPG